MARLFDTPGADEAYGRWQDPPSGHPPECNCGPCHEHHDMAQNYLHPDYPKCCTDIVNALIDDGKWCGDEPKAHADTYMEAGKCLQCRHEREREWSQQQSEK